MPTFMIFQKGQKIDTVTGAVPAKLTVCFLSRTCRTSLRHMLTHVLNFDFAGRPQGASLEDPRPRRADPGRRLDVFLRLCLCMYLLLYVGDTRVEAWHESRRAELTHDRSQPHSTFEGRARPA